MIRLYLAGAALLALIGTGVYVQHLRSANAELREEVASARRELAVQASIAAQKTEAATVARAEAERLRIAATEYDAIREWILRGDDDAPIPDLLRRALDRILHRAPR